MISKMNHGIPIEWQQIQGGPGMMLELNQAPILNDMELRRRQYKSNRDQLLNGIKSYKGVIKDIKIIYDKKNQHFPDMTTEYNKRIILGSINLIILNKELSNVAVNMDFNLISCHEFKINEHVIKYSKEDAIILSCDNWNRTLHDFIKLIFDESDKYIEDSYFQSTVPY